MSALFDLSDRVVVVTGGLGQLGRQFTRALTAHGARVAIIDLPDRCRAEVRRDDDRVAVIPGDVTSRSSLDAALAEIEARWGTPSGLINNAALDVPPDASAAATGPLETYPLEVWQRTLDVNLTGALLALQVFGARMAATGRGSIANVSSTYGLVSPDQRLYDYRHTEGDEFFKPVSYAVSKGGLFNLSRYAATYWGGQGVRVNTLAFGGVRRDQDRRFVNAYESRVPLGRMAREDEYNGAIVFLMSDASSYMTGSTLVVDGGWTAW